MQQAQIYKHFIGRDHELLMFSKWLADPEAPWIMYIHDALEEDSKKGGVGKTWLLRKCEEIGRKEHNDMAVVMIDFFNIANRNQIIIAEQMVTGLRSLYPKWTAPSFTRELAHYRSQANISNKAYDITNIVDTNIQERLSSALVEDLHLLDHNLANEQKFLLVFFDTFELVEQNPAIAVLRLSQTFPDNYSFKRMRVVIAGRNKLDWQHTNWNGREQEVYNLALEPFNLLEMLHYLEVESIFNVPSQSPLTLALYTRTEGRPILVGLAIDVLNHRILTLDELISIPMTDFEGYLVTQVNKLENPLNWVILFMAHVYHRFNISILEWILHETAFKDLAQDTEYQELLGTLPLLSFVRRPSSGDDLVLHDEMRRLVVKYCWALQDPEGDARKEISRALLSYYRQELTQVSNEQLRQAFVIEMLYHRLYVDLADGLRYFQQEFQVATRYLRSTFARLLLQEAQKFANLMSLAQLNQLQLAEAKFLLMEQDAVAALLLLEQLQLLADENWLAEHQSELLQETGFCYQKQSKLSEAADSFSQSLAIEQGAGNELRSAFLLANLGVISRRRGQLDMALHYYEQSIVLYKRLGRQFDYATALTNMSVVYRLQGKTEEALRKCKIAWRIRLDLFHQDKGSETRVGLSLGQLGAAYLSNGNITEAEKCFNEAFTIFLRTNYKAGLAGIYNRLGQVQLKKGEIESAKEWFEKAQRTAQGIDAQQYITSLDEQGSICALLYKWDQAIAFFEQAIAQAQQTLDYYQQTECLIDLAAVFERVGPLERAQQSLLQAEDIATRENYFYLLGRIELIRGKICYSVQDYAKAFQHFVIYCQHMSYYNTFEFNIALRTTLDFLFEIPRNEVSAIVQEILAYWRSYQLDKNYPELVEAFEEALDSISM